MWSAPRRLTSCPRARPIAGRRLGGPSDMKASLTIVLTATVAFGASVALAEGPTVPKPAAQMADLAVFTGTWSCFGRQADSVFGSAHPIDTLQTGASDLDGFWVEVRYTELRTGDNDQPSTGVYTYGYDPTGRLY